MDLKINADLSNMHWCHDVAEVDYRSTKFNLEFDEELKVTLTSEQFENLLKKMIITYTNVSGEDETEKLLESTRAKEAV